MSFGGYWSLIPSIFGKLTGTPTFIILNGTDCIAFPEINYGNLRKVPLKQVIRKSYQWSTCLLPVSASLVRTTNEYFHGKPIELGYSVHLKQVNTPYKVVPNGLRLSDWPQMTLARTRNSFLTVFGPGQEKRKGIPLILELAERRPELTFYFGGIKRSQIEYAPENVHCLGRLTSIELRERYNKVQFYLQLSVFEGFGLSLCEAMLCECVPIGSSVNVIPNIIGNAGYILSQRNINQLEILVDVALAADDLEEKGKMARQRIIDEYSLNNRLKQLVSLLGTSNVNYGD